MSVLLIAIKDAVGGWRALAFLLLALLVAGVAKLGMDQRDAARAALTEHLWADQATAAKQQADMQAAMDRQRADLAAQQQDFENRRQAREHEVENLLADARAGTVRLRERFTCPAGTGVSGAAGAAGTAVDAAPRGLSAADADFLVRFAAECDAVAAERNLGQRYARTVSGMEGKRP